MAMIPMELSGGGWSENSLDTGVKSATAVVSANGWGDITTLDLTKGTWIVVYFVYPNTTISGQTISYRIFDGPNHTVSGVFHMVSSFIGVYAEGNTVPTVDVVNVSSSVTATLSVWRPTGRTGVYNGRIIAYKLSDS